MREPNIPSFLTLSAKLLLCLFLFAGCTAPKGQFTSQKLPGYSGRLEKALLVFMEPEMGNNLRKHFMKELTEYFAEALAQRGIPSAIVQVQRAELDRSKPILAAAEHFHPRQLIVLNVSALDRHYTGPMGRGRYETFVKLEFEIRDGSSGTTVWRADAKFQSPPTPKDAAEELMEQLKIAGLLGDTSACAETARSYGE
jgi:hypothetical protein